MAVLFSSANFTVRELQPEELSTLQALFEADPDYFLRVGGQPPRADEAWREYEELPPPHLGYRARWFAGVFDADATLRGLIILVADLAAPGVWHTALFFLASALRGTGAARELHDALEAHARASGAQWLRLGVIAGNAPAERFWAKCGYREVRTRPLTNARGEPMVSRVMVKALAGEDLAHYLARVPRDVPGSTLP